MLIYLQKLSGRKIEKLVPQVTIVVFITEMIRTNSCVPENDYFWSQLFVNIDGHN